MSQDFNYTDHRNIKLEVTLTTGEKHQELKCSLLRTYSEKYDGCDAHAVINYDEINGLRVDEKRIEPANYHSFKDADNRVWKVKSFSNNHPPEAPGAIFRLSASS
ncbi:hypothetical protein A0J48_005490 [Sphaerospermopsis aphanizomenoides BCCUSP55]|uniref:hypothetical protein n=1 Tax=Sphaerospermopsis aphanizomenoides TaxID=459663 RepID=UPI001908815C|nr:hypothetical protein [Sphaerospermopsis aphanizomenoides]MBK1986997.1 hypothetical protein [Sphaerospermopsis aphanizomenoides BCCUSP55]